MELALSLPLPARAASPSERGSSAMPEREAERRRADPADRRRRPRRLRGLCTSATRGRCTGSRCGGCATAAGPRTRVQETFASVWRSAAELPARAWAGRAVALRGRAECGRRPDPRERASRPPSLPDDGSTEAGPDEPAETDWIAWRVHRAFEELPEHGAQRARARVLERAVAERGRRLPRHPARYREDADAQRRWRAWPTCSKGGAEDERAVPIFASWSASDVSGGGARAAASGCTRCSSQAGPPPELRRRCRSAPVVEDAARRRRSRSPSAAARRPHARDRRGVRRCSLRRRLRDRQPPQWLRRRTHRRRCAGRPPAPQATRRRSRSAKHDAAATGRSAPGRRPASSCRTAASTRSTSRSNRKPAALVRHVPRARGRRRRCG